MGIRSTLSRPVSKLIANYDRKWSSNPESTQQEVFDNLISKAKNTEFGREHDFAKIKNYHDFKSRVPIRDYEEIKPYIDRILKGERDVLWEGRPAYMAKTSGTTSGAKYIPITKESIPNHINSARNAIFRYIEQTGKADFLDNKLIFLSGSPETKKVAGINVGRLSGIVNHHVPGWLKGNQMPSYQTNCIEDWEEKVERIIDETLEMPMSLISGIPPWVQMYFDRIIERTGKPIKDVFPYFSLFIYGGVNFEPYRAKLYQTIGQEIDSIETYPASEGFIAYQDSQHEEGLLLLLKSGIFFEFIKTEDYYSENPARVSIEGVELGVNYAVIINSNAGLWGYSLGDSIKFVSKNPYRILVTGRIEHFISAFGEHVIAEEVEKTLKEVMVKHSETEVVEFSVAPQVNPAEGLPHHEWYVEFRTPPNDLTSFENDLNLHLRKLNPYYEDLISGKILTGLKVINLKKDAFKNYMKTIGKLGGQNKVPRLANDRVIANALIKYTE